MRLLLSFFMLLGSVLAQVQPVLATGCTGRNLIAELPEAELAELRSAVSQVPFSRGLVWRATRGDARIDIVGTYHFDDDRHAGTLARIAPLVADADALLVEAGPEEEERLQAALAKDPTLMVAAERPTLPERLSAEEWQALSEALSQRGIPAVVAAKLRPWYVATMLGLSPCMLKQIAESGETGGIDRELVSLASEHGTPVRALEPWDTLFSIFSGMSPGEELDMIRAALPSAALADDYAVTLADAYFDGDAWLIWEFTRQDAYRNSGLDRATVDQQVTLMQENLMNARNRSWIAPLTQAAEKAAAKGRAVVTAFGALHLPGESGVLRLLEREGWTISAG